MHLILVRNLGEVVLSKGERLIQSAPLNLIWQALAQPRMSPARSLGIAADLRNDQTCRNSA